MIDIFPCCWSLVVLVYQHKEWHQLTWWLTLRKIAIWMSKNFKKWYFEKITILTIFWKKMSSLGQFFDSQMLIFRRVSLMTSFCLQVVTWRSQSLKYHEWSLHPKTYVFNIHINWTVSYLTCMFFIICNYCLIFKNQNGLFYWLYKHGQKRVHFSMRRGIRFKLIRMK